MCAEHSSATVQPGIWVTVPLCTSAPLALHLQCSSHSKTQVLKLQVLPGDPFSPSNQAMVLQQHQQFSTGEVLKQLQGGTDECHTPCVHPKHGAGLPGCQ